MMTTMSVSPNFTIVTLGVEDLDQSRFTGVSAGINGVTRRRESPGSALLVPGSACMGMRNSPLTPGYQPINRRLFVESHSR